MEQQPPNLVDASQITLIQNKLTLEASLRSGINWFFWIGSLSIINSIIYLVGSSLTFVVGLGATQFVDGVATGIAEELSANGATIIRLIGFGIDIAVAGIFITAGFLGHKRYRWAVITGMVLYAFDGVIFIFFGGWLAVAFHGLALWGLWRGLQAISKLQAIEQTNPVSSMRIIPDTEKPTWYKSNGVRILGGIALVFLGIVVALVVIGYILTG